MQYETDQSRRDHRRDVEAGNVLVHNPDFDAGDITDTSERITSATTISDIKAELMGLRQVKAQNGDLTTEERAYAVLLEAELVYLEAEAAAEPLRTQHPKDSSRLITVLVDRIDELEAEGRPVDDIMKIEAHDLAATIYSANPEKNLKKLVDIAEGLVTEARAYYRVREAVHALGDEDEYLEDVAARCGIDPVALKA